MRKVFFILACVFSSQLAMLAHGDETEAPDTSTVSQTTTEAVTDAVPPSDAPVGPANVEEPDASPATEAPDTSATPQATTEAVTDAATPSDTSADSPNVEGPDGTEGTPLSSAATTIKAKDIIVDDTAFKEVLTTAYTGSTALGIAEYQIKSANEEILEAKAGWGPKLSVGSGYSMEFDHDVYEHDLPPGYPPLPNGYRQYSHTGKTTANAELIQNIYAGGATVASIEASKNQALGAQANYSRGQQNTLLKAAKAHLELAKNQAIQELNAKNVSVLGKRLEVAKSRFEFGDATIAEVSTTEAELDKAKSELKAAMAEVEVAKAAYRKEIGKDPVPDLSIPTIPTFLPTSREEVIQTALQNNPVLKQVDADIAVSQAKLDMSYAGLKPQVNLKAGASRALGTNWKQNNAQGSYRNRHNAFTAGAEVKLDLDIMGVNQSKIRKAKYDSALKRIGGIYQRQDVLAKAIETWEKYKSLESRIADLESQIKGRKVAVDSFTEGYLAGHNPILDVLNEEQKYFSAQVELTRVKLDFLYTAFALAEATGSLTPENLSLNVRTFDGQQHYENMSMWGLTVDHDQTEYSGEHLLDLP
jgi:outer membrane protein